MPSITHKTTAARVLSLLALLTVAAQLSACGGNAARKAGPPGSRSNPMVGNTAAEDQAKAKVSEAPAATPAPGYQGLLDRQTSKPRSGFTPCNLVSPSQARAILGTPIAAPVEAPQGPTCIYRPRKGPGMVTIAVQTLDLKAIRRNLHDPKPIAVGGRRAYCGVYGQPMLYAGLPGGRVLSIGARCKVARQFASRAVAHLH
jgi:Protein of unknown function (DUF3558)